jgi:hypothetical protein
MGYFIIATHSRKRKAIRGQRAKGSGKLKYQWFSSISRCNLAAAFFLK